MQSFKQNRRPDAERVSKFNDIQQRSVTLSPLDPAYLNLVAMEVRQLGSVRLGDGGHSQEYCVAWWKDLSRSVQIRFWPAKARLVKILVSSTSRSGDPYGTKSLTSNRVNVLPLATQISRFENGRSHRKQTARLRPKHTH